ncbi:MAG: hypothetical protein JW838_02010 [Spirochaetes bacterium]|nr:hypothetical protein [Spirochaetota bacterium]
MRRNVLFDSSSAIILFKSGLFERTASFYRIVMATSVFRELSVPKMTGAEEFKRYHREGQIMIRNAVPYPYLESDLGNLDVGELHTILLFQEGAGEFIMLDDGKGAACCRRRRIPHTNALLVPRILRRAGIITAVQCDESMETVMKHGRYSRRVIDYARTCEDDDLARFG